MVGKRGRYQRNLISLPMHIDNCVTGYTTVMLLDGFVRRFIDSALGIKFIAQRLQSMPMVRLSTRAQLAASHLELLDKFRRRFLKGSWCSRVFAIISTAATPGLRMSEAWHNKSHLVEHGSYSRRQ